jgi:hypothetical protein
VEADTNVDNSDGGGWMTAMTGHQTWIPDRYRQDITASDLDSLCCEGNYYQLLIGDDDKAGEDDDQYIACVVAGLGGGFENTNELHVTKYKDARNSKDKDNWDEAVF